MKVFLCATRLVWSQNCLATAVCTEHIKGSVNGANAQSRSLCRGTGSVNYATDKLEWCWNINWNSKSRTTAQHRGPSGTETAVLIFHCVVIIFRQTDCVEKSANIYNRISRLKLCCEAVVHYLVLWYIATILIFLTKYLYFILTVVVCFILLSHFLSFLYIYSLLFFYQTTFAFD